MLTAAAEENTVLCVVEDAHWLDSATADALLFCARRLGADRVLLVFSARDGAATPFRPGRHRRAPAARARPGRGSGAPRPAPGDASAPDVTERLIAESGGNPLALLELPTELSPDQLGGSSPLPAQLHLTTRVEQAFLDRSRLLPAPVQSLLLLAAADDTGELSVVRRAAATLGVGEHALEAAAASGLLARRGGLGAGCGTRSCARPSTRPPPGSNDVRLHRALADAAGRSGRLRPRRRGTAPRPPKDPTPRSSPRSSSSGPAPSGAAATSSAAGRLRTRGGAGHPHPAASRTDVRRSPQRLGVRPDHARPGAAGGQPRQIADDPVLLSDIARLQGRIEVNIGSADDAHRIFIEAAHAVHDVDPARALEMAVAAAIMAHLRRRRRRHPGRRRHRHRVTEPTPPGPRASSRCSWR